MNFRMNCAQVEAPISADQSGSGSPREAPRERALLKWAIDDHAHGRGPWPKAECAAPPRRATML
jgi:hypothetical protein